MNFRTLAGMAARMPAILVAFALAILPEASPMAAVVPDDSPLSDAPPPVAQGMLAVEPPLVVERPILLAFSESTTNRVVMTLNGAESECGALASEYRLDCLQQAYGRAASAMSGKPDYDGARSEISRAGRSMKALVDQNLDAKAKPIQKGARRYRAIKKEVASAVNKKGEAIIKEAATRLLRSAGSSQHRKTHYQRIASAVDSTKKILRS